MPEGKQELIAVGAGHQVGADVQQKQRRQMLIALAILLLAVLLLLLKDWHYWFPQTPAPVATTEQLERSIVTAAPTTAAKVSQTPGPKGKVPATTAASATNPPAIVATDRAVLPPLEVEVVSGSRRHAIKTGNNSVRVDLQSDTADAQVTNNEAANSAPAPMSVVQAAETMHLSPDASQVVSRSVEPDYPLLAKEMKVQGSVVLQALIGRDGNIEDLHVLSGPAILSSAAMQAVKQWRFRPYYLSGAPVETQARITVNFTISTN
jgi:TonB family protein